MKTMITNSVAGLLLLSGVSVAIADTVLLAPEQETTIREYVKKEPLASVKRPGVELKSGAPFRKRSSSIKYPMR